MTDASIVIYMNDTETFIEVCPFCGDEDDLFAHPCEIAMDTDFWEWLAENSYDRA